MARLLQSFRRILGITANSPAPSSFSRSIDTDFTIFREGDRAIIQGRVPYLTKPLQHGKRTDVARGYLNHSDIIGKRARDPIQAEKGKEHRLSFPTLDEYVVFTPRLVTPIYGADASLIVSLLDIHVVPPTEGQGDTETEPLEILEAGTGHGSLTLHLARAIQAANTNPPPIPQASQVRILEERPSYKAEDGKQQQEEKPISEKDDVFVAQKTWDEWRAQRRAVIHTVDVSAKFSAHAEQTVRGFRRGIYAGNIDFHVGAVENWIKDQVQRRSATASGIFSRRQNTVQPFLSYAILDMPSAHLRIPHVAPVLRRDGLLAVFMPSITQIGDCVQLIQKEQLPFVMERVVELGMGLSSGRLWDVRLAVKKSRADPNTWTTEGRSSEDDTEAQQTQTGKEETDSESAITPTPVEEDNVLVCRPKVGSRIVGGGFVGIWRRIEDSPKKRN
ncbi:hypothetical protein UA08_04819 [Talaromyces atroroseus]|uniref:tRNA (adenine(58)-N(1))-methyltransferase catalytic subunit TRM61 n=1 Tax=Talaromyces atroroseus TaxID=1441469 RepID=A0A225ANK2_TALAT|nr:hypothetical protein UA08_04819 [Talaromyces atroroseus]OKL59954.1 hypothetical protein UA08_04819 [Talaromyces atroroseus]